MIKGTEEDEGLKEMESKQTGGLIERTPRPQTWSSITALRPRRRAVGMCLSGPTPLLQHPGPQDSLPRLPKPDSRTLPPTADYDTDVHQRVARDSCVYVGRMSLG